MSGDCSLCLTRALPCRNLKLAADTSAAYGTLNKITVTIQPSHELFYPSRVTIGNLLGSTTSTSRDAGLELSGAGAFRFGKGEWVNDLDSCSTLNRVDCVDADARMVLHVENTSWIPQNEPTVVSFYLRNKPFFVEGRVPTISISTNAVSAAEQSDEGG